MPDPTHVGRIAGTDVFPQASTGPDDIPPHLMADQRRTSCRASGCGQQHGERCHVVSSYYLDGIRDVCMSHTADECPRATGQPTQEDAS